ncbi:hypothetical protein BU23DRAFT_635523 [Bimuria novae-zelandiae CBS 107.79]|uniref:CFEM domain-containing protein n=1 Tax=Bimuria novae-zelandiae CBS 107.79 TaxID=1447943 RepID=A0A6A5VC74_9PLEO|nr:hypothetical protein BU23DRAFT_635523 [Bimuria novae-zelandiae CBS 107.79]
MRASIALLISGFAAQQVAANWDRQASNYNTPQYNNNECTDKQKGGYNWSDLNDGDKPGKYDDFDFGGDWSCSTKKFGKRDHVSKRTFGAKAITSKCGKDKPASFSCNKKSEGFSVTHIDVSVDHDAELDFHYKMKDGSICKHRASCKKDGTTVQNTQCGGAESVDVYLGNSSEGREDCEIGFHEIGFDCNPGESYTPPPPYTPAPPSSTSEAPPSSSSEVPSSSTEVPSSSTEVPSSSTEVVPPPETPTPPPQPPACESSVPAESTPAESTPAPSTPAESSSVKSTTPPPAETTPSGECGGYGQPACETSTPVESTPAESTPAESTEVSPPSSTPSSECGSYGQPACETPASSVPAESSVSPSSPASSSPPTVTPPPGGYTPPECLPKCLNTWLKLKSECKDNTDSECYCKVPDLTDNVIDCVKAYGTEEEVKQALAFFVGICAPHVPENPGIIDKCSSELSPPKPTYTPETPATSASPESSGPISSAPAGYPVPSPAPGTSAAPEAPGYTPAPIPGLPTNIPYTTISYGGSSYTVPQVGFTTEAPDAPGANPTEPIALYPVAPTPAPAPANPTAPYPIPSGASGFTSVAYPTGTGAVPSAPGQFTGAASSLNVKSKGVGMVAGAILAFFAL